MIEGLPGPREEGEIEVAVCESKLKPPPMYQVVIINPKKIKNNDPYKIDEIGWFKLSNLPYPLHTGLKIVLSNYQKYLEKYK